MTNVAIGEEIAWLRGYGWSPADIAAKLAVPVMYVRLDGSIHTFPSLVPVVSYGEAE